MPVDGSSSSDSRVRIWLERGESGYWLRDAATGDALKWDDPRVRVVKLAGASYRADVLQDEAFAPGRRLALVREPGDEQAVSLWEFRGEEGRRIGLRVLLAPADAWIQEPRT
jgi:hypothetical protein